MEREPQPVPNAPPDIREQVIRYLLDEMDDAERAGVDEKLVSAPEFSDAIAATEDDLIMRYVRGDLDPRLLSRFNEVYLSSPAKVARVEKARTLCRAVREISAERKPAVVTSLRIRFSIAAVAATIVLAAVLWPLWHRSPGGTSTPPRQVTFASFTLEPGITRSGEGTQITLPRGIDEVHFESTFTNAAPSQTYQAVLGTAERPAAWKGVAVPQDGRLVVVVPVKVLSAGDYMLELQTNGQEATTFYFRVAK